MTAIAKLFMHGRSQAVRLPKDFRMPGREVRVSRHGDKIILEPVRRTREETAAIWSEIDALWKGDDLFPEGAHADDPVEPDLRSFFDP